MLKPKLSFEAKKTDIYNTERFIWGYIAIVQVYSTLLEYFTDETIAKLYVTKSSTVSLYLAKLYVI